MTIHNQTLQDYETLNSYLIQKILPSWPRQKAPETTSTQKIFSMYLHRDEGNTMLQMLVLVFSVSQEISPPLNTFKHWGHL